MMPQQDKIHPQVRQALIADGWLITHEQKKLTIQKSAIIYGIIDILAKQAITAERESEKLLLRSRVFLATHHQLMLWRPLANMLLTVVGMLVLNQIENFGWQFRNNVIVLF